LDTSILSSESESESERRPPI